MNAHVSRRGGAALLLVLACATGVADAQTPATAKPAAPAAAPAGITPPADYVIGPDDVLSIVYWRDEDMTSDVVVRPDGMITLQLLNDVPAAGLKPEQLGARLTEASKSKSLLEDPTITVIVKAINSRKVSITGQVAKQAQYPLTGPMTVMQLIAMAGGVAEYADTKNIRIVRMEKGKAVSYVFNYKDYLKGKGLDKNIELKPGDIVTVP